MSASSQCNSRSFARMLIKELGARSTSLWLDANLTLHGVVQIYLVFVQTFCVSGSRSNSGAVYLASVRVRA
jgi:hypothetical protein